MRPSEMVEKLMVAVAGQLDTSVAPGEAMELRALLRAVLMNPVPQDELAACGRCRSCKRQRALDRAVAALLGGK